MPCGVCVATIDNFQGDAGRADRLSLVRSITSSADRLLAHREPTCAQLSRARHGFYILGNAHVHQKSMDKGKQAKVSAQLEEQNERIEQPTAICLHDDRRARARARAQTFDEMTSLVQSSPRDRERPRRGGRQCAMMMMMIGDDDDELDERAVRCRE